MRAGDQIYKTQLDEFSYKDKDLNLEMSGNIIIDNITVLDDHDFNLLQIQEINLLIESDSKRREQNFLLENSDSKRKEENILVECNEFLQRDDNIVAFPINSDDNPRNEKKDFSMQEDEIVNICNKSIDFQNTEYQPKSTKRLLNFLEKLALPLDKFKFKGRKDSANNTKEG